MDWWRRVGEAGPPTCTKTASSDEREPYRERGAASTYFLTAIAKEI